MGRPILAGRTNVSTKIRIVDACTGAPEQGVNACTAGLALWYQRGPVGSVTALTEADLASLATAHTDCSFIHIDDGYYRVDLPDAAWAACACCVSVAGTVTGMIVIGNTHPLVSYNPLDTVRLGLTALPSAAADAAGGLPISDAGGLDLDGMNTTVANRLAATDYYLRRNTAQAGAAGSITLDASASAVNCYYKNSIVALVAGTGAGQARRVSGYTGSTKVATVANSWATNPASGSTFLIVPQGRVNVGAWLCATPNALVSGRNDSSVGAIAASAITAASIATDAITAAKIAACAIGASELATDAVNEIVDQVWNETACTHTCVGKAGYQVWTRLCSILTDTNSLNDTKIPDTLSLANINAEVDTALNTAVPACPTANSINQRVVAIDVLTEASGAGDLAAILADTGTCGVAIAAAAISTASFAAGAIDAAALATDAANEIRDAVWAQGLTEPTACTTPFSWSCGDTLDAFNWMAVLSRNKMTQTACTLTLRCDADTGTISTATVSDACGTFTRGEWA